MTVHTTYFAALQHDLDVLDGGPSDDVLVAGVLPASRTLDHDDVDRNIPALAPPEDLRDTFDDVKAVVKEKPDVDDATAVAWRSVNFEKQYREHITSAKYKPILSRLRARERDDGDLWLVCWKKNPAYCHRRILADVLTRGRPEDPVHHPEPDFEALADDRLPDAQLDDYATPEAT